MGNKKRVEMLIIDPQNDFYDPKRGALCVAGADADGQRVGKFIKDNIYNIADIHVTQDSHRQLDVAHPMFWIDKHGKQPNPFTPISNADIKNGVWRPFNPGLKMPPWGTLTDRMLEYTANLEAGQDASKTYLINPEKYSLFIWPPHCLISTWGHNTYDPILDALLEWERKRFGFVDYVTKGSNMFTEHYSAVQAEVPDQKDPTTMLNTKLIETLEKADVVLVCGEAFSHCVKYTLTDILNNFGKDSAEKVIILEDGTSSVTGFEAQGQKFLEDVQKIGVKVMKTGDIRF